jgi:leucine-zipper-like transcriptional regulator 1
MGNNPDSPDPEDLVVLGDVWLYDITTSRWRMGALPNPALNLGQAPMARYAHLSAVAGNMLYIIGGQDINNVWLDDVCAYDLKNAAWVSRRAYPRHCGTYRSVAVAPTQAVITPKTEDAGDVAFDNRSPDKATAPESLIHLPYSATPPEDAPSDIYLYSNYNVRYHFL